jgi:hypothetical protein
MSLCFELGTEQSDHSAVELKNGLLQALRVRSARAITGSLPVRVLGLGGKFKF